MPILQLAFGVLVDAFVVRMAIVPAVMSGQYEFGFSNVVSMMVAGSTGPRRRWAVDALTDALRLSGSYTRSKAVYEGSSRPER